MPVGVTHHFQPLQAIECASGGVLSCWQLEHVEEMLHIGRCRGSVYDTPETFDHVGSDLVSKVVCM